MKAIGDRVKELRKKKGLTQGQLGQVLGIGQKSTSMIENNETKLNQEQLLILSGFFNVSIDYLVTGNSDNATQTELEVLNMIRADKNLYQSLVGMLNAKKQVDSRLCA